MNKISENLAEILPKIPKNVALIAVSKFKTEADILAAYDAGIRKFGENYVQELVDKQAKLPEDIEWHFIGHLQSNKVKYLAPFVNLIESVDSVKLLKEINKEALKNDRVIDCLLQIHIAEEATKTGMEESEFEELIENSEIHTLKNVKIIGLMGIGTFTDNENVTEKEFKRLKYIFDKTQLKVKEFGNFDFREISMGMSGDWELAIKNGSTMVRIGSAIFGERNK